MKAVIVIPTFNEKGNIEKLVEILENEVFPKIKKHELHILVVDDSSPDGTGEEVKKLSKKYGNVALLINEKKVGLGAASIS
ncbi:MAG: Glycosyl transferase, group 2 family protein [Candidatus Levybacteria bacterium GW2011_GWA1_39_32]|nr:MAG: Glycosyl transferase, group 2 family protein [Candidatus Levybacteria bacterium GW2011_GWA1_39_32]